MIIIPFGDNQSHGTLAGSVIYARRRGQVYCKKYKSPKNPNSVAQQAQRSNFQDAVAAWQAMTEPAKDIWRGSATGKLYTGYNLFIRWFLLNPVPVPFIPSVVNNMVILTTRSPVSSGWQIWFAVALPTLSLGTIYDNSNNFLLLAYPAAQTYSQLIIHRSARAINIQYGDKVRVTHGGVFTLDVCMPAIAGTHADLYIAHTGATYWDVALTNLACPALP